MIAALIGILFVCWLSVRVNAKTWFAACHAYYGFPAFNILGQTLATCAVAGAQYLALWAWSTKEGLGGVGLAQVFRAYDHRPWPALLAAGTLLFVALSAFVSFTLAVWRMGYTKALPVSAYVALEARRAMVRQSAKRSGVARFIYDRMAKCVGEYRALMADKAASAERKEFATAFACLVVVWCLILGPAAFVVACVFHRRLRALAQA